MTCNETDGAQEIDGDATADQLDPLERTKSTHVDLPNQTRRSIDL